MKGLSYSDWVGFGQQKLRDQVIYFEVNIYLIAIKHKKY